MNLYRGSAVLTPNTLRDGARIMRSSGWSKKTRANSGNSCWDNGEDDCSSLYIRVVSDDFVKTSVRKAKVAAIAKVAQAETRRAHEICTNCFIPKYQCNC